MKENEGKWENEKMKKKKNEKKKKTKKMIKKERKMKKIGFTRKIQDDFQGLPLLL